MAKGRVSVVIPCFNYSQFLAECVHSVLEQDYPVVEIVIVDDGSSDKTPEVAFSLVAEFPERVRFFRSPNRGVGAARNLGIEKSSGDYILPLDADDKLLPHAISRLVEALEQDSKHAIAYGCVRFLDPLPGEPTEWIPGPFNHSLFLMQNLVPTASLFRRSVWEAGAHYRDSLIYEDWDLWLQIVGRGYSVEYVPEQVYAYRVHLDGRYAKGKFSFFHGLAQIIRGNPTLYQADATKAFAETMLINAPRCLSRPTILVFRELDTPFAIIAKDEISQIASNFAKRGHSVVVMGNVAQTAPLDQGVYYLRLTEEMKLPVLLNDVQKYGSQVIILSERGGMFLRAFRTLKNSVIRVKVSAHGDTDSVSDADAYLQLDHCGAELSVRAAPEQKMQFDDVDGLAAHLLTLHHELEVVHVTKVKQEQAQWYALHRGGPRIDAPFSRSEELSVALPLRNVEPSRLARCLEGLRLTAIDSHFPILLSDYGSAPSFLDHYRSLSHTYGALLIESQTRQPWSRSRALNIAIRACCTEMIIFTDVDMIFSPKLIPLFRRYYEEFGPKRMYLAQCIKLPPIPDLPSPWRAESFEQIAARGRLFETYGQGGFQGLSVEWLTKIGGLNEAYQVWGAEDNDLSFRAELDGIAPLWMTPGLLLHQWHLKNVPANDVARNIQHFEQLRVAPTLRVNTAEWGRISEGECINYQTAGALPSEGDPATNDLMAAQRLVLDKSISDSRRVELLSGWGYRALRGGQFETALETFEDVLTLSPGNQAGLEGLMMTHWQRKSWDRAAHLASELLRIDGCHEMARRIRESFQTMAMRI